MCLYDTVYSVLVLNVVVSSFLDNPGRTGETGKCSLLPPERSLTRKERLIRLKHRSMFVTYVY